MRLVGTEAGDAKLGSGKNVPNVDRLIMLLSFDYRNRDNTFCGLWLAIERTVVAD